MNETWIRDTFLELVQIDSHSLEEGAIAKRCRTMLEQFGFAVEEDGAGKALGGQTGNLIATLKGDPTLPRVLLAAHMDTVRPGEGVKPHVDANGVVWSDGSTVLGADDKAGVTAIFAALREIVDQKAAHGDIQVVLTIAEEIGLQGARHLDGSLIHADYGLSLDSGGKLGTLAVKGPAQARFEATFRGRKAHAGVAPERGISAIKVAANGVARMPHGRIDEETTVNVGSFVGQGPTNVVADMVTLVGEARSRDNAKLDRVLGEIESAFREAAEAAGANVEYDAKKMYDGFNFTADAPVRKRIERSLQACGFTVEAVEVGGGSDANLIQAHVPIMNIGIGYEEIHTTEEHIRLADIAGAARVAYAFCTLPE